MVVLFSGTERSGTRNGADCSAEELTFKSLYKLMRKEEC